MVLAVAMAAGPASARCARDEDQAIFDVQALKSELMVLAIGCHQEDKYNEFVTRYRTQLVATERGFAGWFDHAFGRRARARQDAFITELANLRAQRAQALGSDYCPRNGVLFGEVMALPAPTDLASYAGGKNLLPPQAGACEGAPAAAPARAAARPARAAR